MGFEGTATLTTAQAKAQLDNPLEALWQTRLCATLKQAGVDRVGDRQAVANALAKAARGDLEAVREEAPAGWGCRRARALQYVRRRDTPDVMLLRPVRTLFF